jgi:hypothetical protein
VRLGIQPPPADNAAAPARPRQFHVFRAFREARQQPKGQPHAPLTTPRSLQFCSPRPVSGTRSKFIPVLVNKKASRLRMR